MSLDDELKNLDGLFPNRAIRRGSWMQTFTGRAYWPADPHQREVRIEDIAHSLSMQCRYGGHSSLFYSVAEHSVYVSRLVPPEHALVGLLHDATEAYCSDVPRPLKPFLSNYADLEELNWGAIAAAFDLDFEIPACVMDVDRRLCLTEMKQLMKEPPMPLGIEGEAPNVRIYCREPDDAKRVFLDRFSQLWGDRLMVRYPSAGACYLKGAA